MEFIIQEDCKMITNNKLANFYCLKLFPQIFNIWTNSINSILWRNSSSNSILKNCLP